MTRRHLGHRRRFGMLALVLAGALTASACGGSSSASPSAPSPSFGIVQDRPVPDVPLVDQTGRPTSLAAFQGKVVVLANFLSLCQDECPMITGAFIAMQRDVQAAGLANRVAFLEVSIDPGRDTPARLAAYSQQFGANWPLLTGTPADLNRLWSFFGVSYQQVPEEQPPKLDWWTHQPLTYDVTHTDGFVLLDPRGHERFITANPPDLHGRLAPSLQGLLNDSGVNNLEHQQAPNWTVPQALGALGWLVGRPIPQTGG
ncbi:MAG TPA: SCO family protein [Acidimicrobiales bacterium]|nr:SCO family protein [Acidimicrobiales bacterium]